MSNILKLSVILAILVTFCGNSFADSTIEQMGFYTQFIVPAYAFGMAINEKDWEGVRQLTYSYAATLAVVHGLKNVVDEERPNGSDNKSFPSGHTASAFSGATFIHKRYGIKRAIVPYLLAGFTGYTRVQSNKHHVQDVIAGAVISGLFSWLFVSEYSQVQISVSPDSVNLALKVEF